MSEEDKVNFGKMLASLRDSFQSACEAIDEFLSSLGEKEAQTPAVAETLFNSLKYEAAKSGRLGNFETCFKSSNLPEPW